MQISTRHGGQPCSQLSSRWRGAEHELAERRDHRRCGRPAICRPLRGSRCLTGRPGGRRIGVAELVQFLSDPRSELPPEAQRLLFSNPRLRADFKRLKTSLRCVELPALAAASDGAVDQRSFEGGSVRLHPSRVGRPDLRPVPVQLADGDPARPAAGERLRRHRQAPAAGGGRVGPGGHGSGPEPARRRRLPAPDRRSRRRPGRSSSEKIGEERVANSE